LLKIKKFLKEEKKITSIVMISFAFCILFIFTNKMPELFKYGSELMNFLYAISISIIAASIFYVLNIYLPGQKRKNIIRQDFEEQYLYFKKECIYIFLSALGKSINPKLVQKLCDLDEFKKYFKEKCGNGQIRWDKVATELDCNKIFLKNILVQLGILRNEAAFILNNTEINDKSVLSFFKILSQQVYAYRERGINMVYDEKKEILHFLWQLFSGWSFSDGYREGDIVKLMIEKI
jgi:hypothetical protein